MADDKDTGSRHRYGGRIGFEWIAAILLATLVGICFYLQVSTASNETTQREVALFNALQFILTTGFAWFSTRAVSRNEFEESLRRFAISAYRRVADIDRMIVRLQAEVQEMMSDRSQEDCADLRIVDAIVSDTNQIVRSSISDWADVIGDELLALEKIRRLEQAKDVLKAEDQPTTPQSPATPTKADIGQLDSEIRKLVSSLPPRLQLEARARTTPSVNEQHAARWLRGAHQREQGLRTTVVTGKGYDTARDQSTLAPNERLIAVRTKDGGLDVHDSRGNNLGRLQNPTPLSYTEFSRAFELCFGPPPVALEFLRDLGKEVRGGEELGWIRVKILAEPVIQATKHELHYPDNKQG